MDVHHELENLSLNLQVDLVRLAILIMILFCKYINNYSQFILVSFQICNHKSLRFVSHEKV